MFWVEFHPQKETREREVKGERGKERGKRQRGKEGGKRGQLPFRANALRRS